MPDKLTPEQRHKCMSHIRAKDTQPEMKVRRFLYSHGFRYRLHVKKLPGTPDIVIRRLHTAILVNGCFWHGHDCSLFVMPKTRVSFWENKISKNRERDERVRTELTKIGWNVITMWECSLDLNGLLYTLNNIEYNMYAKDTADYKLDNSETGSIAADTSKI